MSRIKLEFMDGWPHTSLMDISEEVAIKIQTNFRTQPFSLKLLLELFELICVSASVSTDNNMRSWFELVFEVDGIISTSKTEISTDVSNRITPDLAGGRKFNMYIS